MLAYLLWQCLIKQFPLYCGFVKNPLICFLCCPSVCETRRIFSVLSSQKCQDVFLHSFWVSSFHSRMLLQATLVLSLVASSLNSVCCDFFIFSQWSWLIACPLFNLVRNSVVYSPSSVIRDPKVWERIPCSSSSGSFWMSILHAMLLLTITLVLSTLMSRLYSRLTRFKWSTNSCSSASEVASRMCHQHSEGSCPFALQFVVHLEIHRGSPSSPSPLGCWTSTEKGHNLVGPLS